jgi:hypothetical protein
MTTANDKQVGGDHYKQSNIQHWDWSWASGHDPFQYQITKYVDRHFKKNGLQDLLKAKHFLEKYIELLTGPGGKYQIQQPTYGDGVMEREWEHGNLEDLIREMEEPGIDPGPGYVNQDPDWSTLVGSPNSALPSGPLGDLHDNRHDGE